MAIDWLDAGFNIVIGLFVLGIMFYIGQQILRMIQKQKGKKDEEKLDDLMNIQKLMRKK